MNVSSNFNPLRRPVVAFFSSIPVFCIFLGLLPLEAAEEVDPSIKLREQLRGVMLQLRTSQTEAANAKALQAAADAKNLELAAQLKKQEENTTKIVKKSEVDKVAFQESIGKLETKLADREKRVALLDETLLKWKAGYEKAAGIARTKEDERAKLAEEITVLQRTVADRERKNIALFNTANEILVRFEGYALGTAIAAREPFIGTSRVKVENLVQGYKDKILDNRLSNTPKKP
jgi:hypothetical protein